MELRLRATRCTNLSNIIAGFDKIAEVDVKARCDRGGAIPPGADLAEKQLCGPHRL